MRIIGLILLVLLSAPALPAPVAMAGPRRLTCGATDESVSKTADVEYAGIVPGRGLVAEDFADGGLLVVADPSLYQITDDPVGMLRRAAHNWEIPGTMIRFRVVMGPVEGGNLVYAENIGQAARATVGRPGWGRRGSLFMVLDVPFSRSDDSLVAVMTHEIGHWLGFDHSFLGSTVMFPVLTDRINWVDPDQVAKATARYAAAPNALGEVRGHVTRDGAPLVGARVNLLGSNGRTAFATFAGDDGVYHVPVFAGTYRVVVDPNDGPAVDGNFIGTYPGGPLDFATHEVPGQVVVSAGQTLPVDVAVPSGGDVAFRITTAEPTTCGPGAGSQGVSIYYEGATPAEIAGVDALSPDVHVFNVTDSGGKIAVFFDVEPGALPGGRSLRVRKTNGAVAIVPGIVGVVAPLYIEAPHYALESASDAELAISWVNNVPRDETAAIVVSASLDGGFAWEEIGRVHPSFTSIVWRPDAGLVTSALRLRVEALDAVGSRLAVDESIFNVGLGLPARGVTGDGADADAPEVRVVAPNGGETLVGGEEVRIAWSAFDDLGVSEQQVDVSVDGGRQWVSVGAFGPAVRATTWVPGRLASDAVLVRVTARDRAGNAGTDASDAAARVRLRPEISRVVLKPKGDGFSLKVKGAGFAAGAVVRVNGEVVGVPVAFAGGTLKARGDAAALHLRPAGETNTLVVEVEGLASVEVVF